MTDDTNFTRRRMLASLGASTLATLAGCQSQPTEQPPEDTATTPTDTTTTKTTPDAPTINVTFQQTDERAVTVQSTSLPSTGWLVIHPEKSLGTPNPKVVLGAKLLEDGKHEDVVVKVDRMLAESQTLYAMLHHDDPADGDFTFPESGDPPFTVDGNPVTEPFTVTYTGTLAPALEITDQETDGTYVEAMEAVIDKDGWLVIHPENAAGDGPDASRVLGKEYLRAGTYADKRIDLSTTVTETQTLYAMLHYDDPANETFTFPETGDPPVEVGGKPVVKQFELTITK